MDTKKYQELFVQGKTSAVVGLCGRIIRGTKPDDFKTLTDDPNRKLVMLMGSDGLEKLLGKTGYDMLVEIGYEPDYIERKVNEGNQFKLVVFPDNGPAKIATWDNLPIVLKEVYPEIEAPLNKFLSQLKSIDFDAIESQAGFDFSEVDKLGNADPRFMTYDRFIKSSKTLVDVRAFLYFTVHLRELFSGDGYTYTSDGTRGMLEYIVSNKPISKLGENQVIDIEIKLPNQGGIKMKKQNNTPAFFDPKNAERFYRVDYAGLAVEAEKYAKQNNIKPSAKDIKRICLMPIDVQNTFCLPDFELFVGGQSGRGAIDDNIRLSEFIYNNLDTITEIAPTMDTHTAIQIFHPVFWINDKGQHPIGGQTVIALEDVEKGVWRVNPAIAKSLTGGNYIFLQKYALHYVKQLTSEGKYPLMVWPYHAMLGGIGHALASIVEEAIFFHTMARINQTGFQIKGGHPLTENYSVLQPEVKETEDGTPVGQKNTLFIKKLLDYDVVIIAGQAKSHCVAWTINDLLNEILANDPALAKKVYLLEDCTSPVVIPGVIDFTQQADEAFQKFADAGMNIVQSTTPIKDWPGINL